MDHSTICISLFRVVDEYGIRRSTSKRFIKSKNNLQQHFHRLAEVSRRSAADQYQQLPKQRERTFSDKNHVGEKVVTYTRVPTNFHLDGKAVLAHLC